MEPTNHNDLRATLSSALRTSDSVKDLRSGLAQLYDTSAAVLSSSKYIENVWYQIFERFAGRLGAASTTTVSRNRQWGLSIQLSRTFSGLALPLLQLDIISIYPGRRCKVQGRHLPDPGLSLSLLFHLKPSSLDQGMLAAQRTHGAEGEHPTGPIQPIVDQLLRNVLRSIRGFNFVSENSMLSKIEHAVLDYIRASPLAALVDFHLLQVTSQTGPNRERVVISRYLNADGSGREARKDLEDRTEAYTSLSARLRARQASGSGDLVALPSPFSTDSSQYDIKRLVKPYMESIISGSLPL